MSTYELGIDGTSAEAGANKIVKSFDSIKAAADRMEGGVSAAARKATSSFNSLSGVRGVSSEVLNSISSLSKAMSSFKGPSSASADNTLKFLNGLKSVGSVRVSAAGLAPLLNSLSGFKGPSGSSASSTTKLLDTLGKFSGLAGSTRGVGPILSALANFKGPNASAAKNTQALLTAVSNFKAPSGLASVTQAFIALSNAANQASGSVGKLKSLTSGSTTINVNAKGAASSIAALTKEHDLLHSAIFKTQTLYRSLGGIFALREILTASGDVTKIKAQLEAATGSVEQARVQFFNLTQMANRMGLEFTSLAKSYGFFLGSIKGTNVSFKDAEDIFRGFSTAARALQLSTSDVDGVFRALGQIMSKGKLQAEELRGQLGDRLPGAFVRFARALDLTKPGELDAALKAGSISGDRLNKAILEVAQTMEVEFSVAADKMAHTVDAAMNRLKNAFTFSSADFGTNGFNDVVISIADSLTGLLKSSQVSAALKVVAGVLTIVTNNMQILASAGIAYAILMFGRFIISLNLVTRASTLFYATLSAAKLIQAAYAVGGLTAAFSALNVATRANLIGLVITALTLLVYWLTQSATKTDEYLDSLRETGASSGIAANGVAAFTAQLADNNGKLDLGNQLLRERIALNLANRQDAYVRSRAGLTYERPGTDGALVNKRGGIDNGNYQNFLDKARGKKSPAAVVDSDGTKITDPYLIQYLRQTGGVGANANLRFSRTDGKKLDAQYRYQYEKQSGLGAYVATLPKGSKERAFGERLFNESAGNLETLGSAANRMAGNKVYVNDQDARNRVFDDPDRITQTGGLSGAAAGPKPKKGPKGPSDAGNVEDIRRAIESLRDLNREVEASDAAIASLSDRSVEAVSVQANAAAQAKVDNFEDSFKTAELAQKGLVRLAAEMKSKGMIPTGIDIGDFTAARKAIYEHTRALEELNLRRKKDAEVAGSISDLRVESAGRLLVVAAIKEGGRALEDANIAMEVEKQLIGTSEANREKLRAGLTEELRIRNQLNRAEEIANSASDLGSKSKIETSMSGLLGKGYSEDELSYYREMYTEREKLINQGWEGDQLRYKMALKKADLDLAQTSKDAFDEEQKLRALAADQADAVVNGFKKGIEAGDNFLKTIGNIFVELKNIFLDFVLYNPLREFLKDTLQGAAGQNSKKSALVNSASAAGIESDIKSVLSVSSISGYIEKINSRGTFSPNSLSETSQVSATSQAAKIAATNPNETGQSSSQDIVVSRRKAGDLNSPVEIMPPQGTTEDKFKRLRDIFDYKTNGVGASFKDLGKAVKGLDFKAIGKSLGPALKAAGTAFAAFSIGQGVGKTLGLGRTGSNVLGGAAAGFTVAGPAGAAIGAAVALIGSLFGNKKIPSSFGSVTVGANGSAQGGAGQIYGKGDISVGKAAGAAGASLFNSFAQEYDARLKAGNYGTFGRTKFKGQKEEQSFYSITGAMKKGKPTGREGIDYIRGTDSEVQAFALRTALKNGSIQGLSPVLQTVGQNTTGTSVDAIQADFNIGKAYEEFIKSSFKMSDVAKQVQTLNDGMEKLAKQAVALGLSEERLKMARDRILVSMKKEFDFNINQGILGIQDPKLAAYNALEKEYRDTVENGMAVGGDLLAVEKLYGLKRVDLAKQLAQQEANVYKDLLTNLTASSNSPLNADTVLTNARDRYESLRTQLKAGDTSGIGNLSTYTDNYLNAAKDVNASSSGYFDIFNQVTEFLQSMSDKTTTANGSTTGEVPSLPTLDSIIAEITAKNKELLEAQQNVGLSVVTTGADTVDALNRLGLKLDGINDSLRSSGVVIPGFEFSTRLQTSNSLL